MRVEHLDGRLKKPGKGPAASLLTRFQGPADYAFAALILATLPLDGAVTGRLRRRIEAGETALRMRAYLALMGFQWASCLFVVGSRQRAPGARCFWDRLPFGGSRPALLPSTLQDLLAGDAGYRIIAARNEYAAA